MFIMSYKVFVRFEELQKKISNRVLSSMKFCQFDNVLRPLIETLAYLCLYSARSGDKYYEEIGKIWIRTYAEKNKLREIALSS